MGRLTRQIDRTSWRYAQQWEKLREVHNKGSRRSHATAPHRRPHTNGSPKQPNAWPSLVCTEEASTLYNQERARKQLGYSRAVVPRVLNPNQGPTRELDRGERRAAGPYMVRKRPVSSNNVRKSLGGRDL